MEISVKKLQNANLQMWFLQIIRSFIFKSAQQLHGYNIYKMSLQNFWQNFLRYVLSWKVMKGIELQIPWTMANAKSYRTRAVILDCLFFSQLQATPCLRNNEIFFQISFRGCWSWLAITKVLRFCEFCIPFWHFFKIETVCFCTV